MMTPEQLTIIETQLGRKPRGIERIAVATDAGIPVVLQMRSLVDDRPFPTLYWLSSKDLYQAIATIETSGWVKQIEQRIEEDAALRQQLEADHRGYVALRWQLMRDEDRERIAELGFSELFDRYGIGGIAQWDRVRCLHMHYAHHLCSGNLIGSLLDQEFELNRLEIRQ